MSTAYTTKAWLPNWSGLTLDALRNGGKNEYAALVYSQTAAEGKFTFAGDAVITLTIVSTADIKAQRIAELQATKDAIIAAAAVEAARVQAQIDAVMGGG